MFARNPIVPKNADGVARIISVGRLSQPKDTVEETLQSLEAIRRENERMLAAFYDGAKVIRYLAEQTSGMLAVRETMNALWELVDTGEWDAIVSEDLSRIFRNPRHQLAFVQDCVDAGIRVICFADNLDTADESWEASVLLATARHGLMIPDTRRRIKRTATEAFKRGGMVMKTKAFYCKVTREDAAAGNYGPVGLRIRRLVELAWAVDEIRRRLLEGCSPRSIVAWLRAEGIPCGPYAKQWTLKLFRELVRDPILHGTRMFRDVVHKQIFRTGKYRRDKNATPDLEYVPELAFMTREEQEAMLAAAGWTINWGGNNPPKRPHPRKGFSRYDSYWPAQSTICSACGDKVFSCGGYLRCSNSFPHLGGTCWNHVQAPIAPLREFLVTWLVEQCAASDEFRAELLTSVKQQLHQQQNSRAAKHDALEAKVKDLQGQERNLRKSIQVSQKLSDKQLESLVADLAAVTDQIDETRRQAGSSNSSDELVADYTDEYILAHLDKLPALLLSTSFEMAEVIRGFVPRCEIVPVQSWDGGQVYPRAKLQARDNMQDHTQLKELVVDLFEPPLHIRYMAEAVRLRGQEPRPTLKQIGAVLGVSYMTVKRALAYDRLMHDHGVAEPYRELDAKPDKAARWRDASYAKN